MLIGQFMKLEIVAVIDGHLGIAATPTLVCAGLR